MRFEVVGNLHATATAEQPVRVRDISDGGLLIETPCPLPVDSIVNLKAAAPQLETEVEAHVRHVTTDPGGTLLLGLEFQTISPPLLQFIRDWLASLAGQVMSAGAAPIAQAREGQ
jgi:hypothetical protein